MFLHCSQSFCAQSSPWLSLPKCSLTLCPTCSPPQSTADRGGRQRLHSKEAGTGRLVEAEQRAKGTLKLSVYKKYWTEASVLVPVLVFSLFGIVQAIDAYNRYWLSYWTENKFDQGLGFYLGA